MALVSGFRRTCRRLLRTPLFSAVSVLTLGVGIGATTAIFSVVYGVLLKPLPYPDPDRLVGVWHTAPGLGIPQLNMSTSAYVVYRESNRVFDDIGMWGPRQVTITGRGDPERVSSLFVTDGTLPILGVQPVLGRLFTAEDTVDKAPRRAILGHGYWQRRFGGARDVIGQVLTVDGNAREVVGVLPAGFRLQAESPMVVLPIQFNRADLSVGGFSFLSVARLKPGATLDHANRDLARMIPLQPERFKLPGGFTRKMFDDIRMGPSIRPLADDVIGDVGQVLWVLLGTVGIVLLIACANVANLFLVRTEGRQQELALRAALGASRARVARDMLGESVTLGLVGGLLGLLLARAGLGLLLAIAPASLPRLDEIRIDVVVLLFALGVSVAAGLLFGLVPVLRFGTPSIAALKEGGRSVSEGPGRHRARNVLVVVEIALALVLLVVSGLMIRTFVAMRQVEPGFVRPEEVQTFRISIPGALIKDDEQVLRAHEQIAERLAAVPGVSRVGVGSSITMDGQDSNDPIFVEDRAMQAGEMPPVRRFKWIGPGYVETLGNRLLAGRTLTWTDAYRDTRSVLVSENFAREFWKEPAAAIGKRIRQNPSDPWREIVGVIGDARDDGLHKPAPAIIYWPMLMKQFWGESYVTRGVSFAVRSTRAQSAALQRELQAAVWSVNPGLPLANVRTLDQIRSRSMAQTSFALVMLAMAAAVALLLGVVGIYGVIAYIAAQRTREIGIRMALGAQALDVSRLFLRHGLWLAGSGVLLGVLASLALTHLMSSLLFGVSAMDPITYVAVSIVLGLVAVVATWVPARRAARIDPIVALRSDA